MTMSWVGMMIGWPLAGLKTFMGRHHQRRRFNLCLDGERQVDGHLIAIEIGIKALADKRVHADRVAFHPAPARTPECPSGAGSGRGSTAPGDW